jgi:hypothetical protein
MSHADYTHKGPRQSRLQQIGRLRRYLIKQGLDHDEVERQIRVAEHAFKGIGRH